MINSKKMLRNMPPVKHLILLAGNQYFKLFE